MDWSAAGAAVGSGFAAVLAHRAHSKSSQAVSLETYLHNRMHDLLNYLYALNLGVALILREMGHDMPDPKSPTINKEGPDGA